MRLSRKCVFPIAVFACGLGTLLLLFPSTARVSRKIGPTARVDVRSALSVPSSTHPDVYISDNDDIMSMLNFNARRKMIGRRRHQIESVCKRDGLWENYASLLPKLSPKQIPKLFVNDKRKIIYCEVPKVACTNWKRILLILTGKMNTTIPEDLIPSLVHSTYQEKYLKRLSDYEPAEIQHRLNTYYKFMFVREPFERILSAYRNKFQANYSVVYQKRFGTKIVERFRENPTNDSLSRGHDVTFQEFVRFLLDPGTKKPFDPHWRSFHELCQPCAIHYDFVGKYETLDEDVKMVLKELDVEHLVQFPRRPVKLYKTTDLLQQAYANISADDIKRLWGLYAADFKLFGYKRTNPRHSR